jgi:hypothetical protein
MTQLLASLGQKVAARWLESVLAPGLAYLAVAIWALLAGQQHPFDLTYLGTDLNRWWTAHTTDTGAAVVATVALLAAATAAGMAVTAVATRVVQPLWSMKRPAAPGDRMRRAGRRIAAQYSLDLTAVWTRIWLLADSSSREIVSAAARRYRAATELCGWGLLLLPWMVRSWPAGVIAALALGTACVLGTERAAVFATVVESTVDLYAGRLAQTLGVTLPEGRVDAHKAGPLINSIVRKVTDDH